MMRKLCTETETKILGYSYKNLMIKQNKTYFELWNWRENNFLRKIKSTLKWRSVQSERFFYRCLNFEGDLIIFNLRKSPSRFTDI